MRVWAKVSFPLRRRWHAVAMLLLCVVGGLAHAQSAPAGDAADPPSRVARLSYMAGDVGFLPAGASAWGDASINRPLTTGDRLSTGNAARAELEFGGGTLHMDGATDFGLLDLSGQIAQIELTQGTLSLTVRDLEAGQSYEIDTPTVALVVDRPGTFRVDVGDGSRATRIAVLSGGAIVYGENNVQRDVSAGRSYQFDDTALAQVGISDIDGGDAFDAWANDRDQRYVRSTTSEYVSDQVVGYQDLDQYGDWQTDSDYGAVWYPTQVAVGWAPYSSGHWAYIAPWGWSWVDDAAWGFAPYHYGRWANLRGRWGWVPGPRDMYPVYAPALVAFVGGGGWSVGIGSGPVGWFPLGPGEFYNPWYRASRNYYTNVNITNIYMRRGYDRSRYGRDIDNHYNHYRTGQPVRGERYANRNAPRGFTVVSGQTFAGGRPVREGMARVQSRQLAAAAVLPQGIAARPAGGGSALPRNAHVRSLPTGGFNREVVARRAPPAAFAERRADTATGNARGGRPQVAAPSRVRLLTAGAQDASARPLTSPGADRAAASQGGAVDRVRTQGGMAGRADAAQRNADDTLMRDRAAAAARPTPTVARASARGGNAPAAAAEAGAAASQRPLPGVAPIQRTELGAGELPSARFARPDRRTPVRAGAGQRTPGASAGVADAPARRSQSGASQRPGLSIISRGDAEQATPAADSRRGSMQSLPQVPRFERAPGNATPVSSAAPPRAAFNERQRVVQHNVPTNEPGMQQRQSSLRAEQRRAQPQQEMTPRAIAPRASGAAPRQAYPSPRMAVPPPARGANAAPVRKATRPQDDRSRRSDQQH